MIEKPLHYNTVRRSAPIWNVLPVPGKPWMVMEERDDISRKVTFSAFDYANDKLVWINDSLTETWWINLVQVTAKTVWLKIFDNTSNPDVTRWLTLTVEDGALDEKTDPAEPSHTNELIRPFQYLAGEPDFETVSNFLQRKLKFVLMLGTEYLEHAGFIFISFYFGPPASFTNQLVCFSTAGTLLWQIEIGANLKGMGVNTFFVVSDYLFFVKNRTELVTFRIV